MQEQYRQFSLTCTRRTHLAVGAAVVERAQSGYRGWRVRPNPSVKRTLHGLPKFMRKEPRINSVNPFRAAYLTR